MNRIATAFKPYQLKWINDDSPVKFFEKQERGIGITYAASYRCFCKCIKQSNHCQWVLNINNGMSAHFAKYVTKWAYEANVEVTVRHSDNSLDIGSNSLVIEFENKSKIFLLCNHRALLGKIGDILLDDFDEYISNRDIFDTSLPSVAFGYQLEVISSPRNMFCIGCNNNTFSYHSVEE